MVSVWLMLSGFLAMYYNDQAGEGRHRLYLFVVGFVTFCIGMGWLRSGGDCTCCRRRGEAAALEAFAAEQAAVQAAGAFLPPPGLGGLPPQPFPQARAPADQSWGQAPPEANRELQALHAFAGGVPPLMGPPDSAPFPPSVLGQAASPKAFAAPPKAGSVAAAPSQQGYAPYAAPSASATQSCAHQVKGMLEMYAAHAATDPWWGPRFWQAVAQHEAVNGLDASVLGLVRGMGYAGAGTQGAPDARALGECLARLEATAMPPGGQGLAGLTPSWSAGPQPGMMPGPEDSGANLDGADARWASQLPPDLRRAAPDIHRNMLGAGVANTREWLNQNFQGAKTSEIWTDLWTAATAVDYRILQARAEGGPAAVAQVLNRDDSIELSLRRLASHIYLTRTRDRVGATQMLGVAPPGAGGDIAPTWLVSDATLHSRNEYRREEQVAGAARRRNTGPSGGGEKGKGKGKGKKGAEGATPQ